MFRDALKELRYHPGRVIATLVAIAISVGFMAAVSIFVTTQSDALGKQASLTSSKADVVATVAQPKPKVTPAQLHAAAEKVPGVARAESSATTQMSLSTSHGSEFVTLFSLPSEEFRWAGLKDGHWPASPTEIAIATKAADKLQVRPGDTVDAFGQKLTVSGITDEPASMFFQSAYAAPALVDAAGGGSLLVRTTPGTDPDSVVAPLHDALAPLVTDPDQEMFPGAGKNLQVDTAEAAQAQAVKQIAGEFDVMKYVLWVFSGIAALVGMIIISNTFTILLAQRRRQIGLLRAVGASGSQVRRRFLAEAVVLGIVGSLLGLVLGAGVASLGAWYTKAIHWGLSLPWRDLAAEVAIGTVLTVLAAMLPSLQATRVAPLEALQPVATSEQERKASIVRSIICGLLFLAGLALALTSLDAPVADGTSMVSGPVARAMVGAMLVALGVLFGAPLFIPVVLRAMGRLFGLFGATPKLAATNAVRNPRRASATATALMLACGLIVTLQVGAATAEKTALAEIRAKFPVDISLTHNPTSAADEANASTIPVATLARIDALPNVGAKATLLGGPVTAHTNAGVGGFSSIAAVTADVPKVAPGLPATLPDDQVLTTNDVKRGTRFTVKGNGQTVTLTSVPSRAVDYNVALVSQATMTRLVAKPTPQAVWLKLANPDDFAGIMTQTQQLRMADRGLNPSGSVAMSYMIRQILNVMLMVITALLGAAVLISLIGVSNTLGLSVIERTRESALLRALGMQKGSLRLMLLVEALMLALAGVLVGVAMGSFFGWLGVRSVLRQAQLSSPVQFGVDLPRTLGLIGIAVVAAALASVLPGRRAANATPTQALAE